MEENKNIDKGIKSRRERFKMDPTEDAWKRLDADLERQRALKYKARGNQFKMLSIGLAVLLISVLAYFYFTPNQTTIISDSSKIKTSGKVENNKSSGNSNGGEVGTNSLADNSTTSNVLPALKDNIQSTNVPVLDNNATNSSNKNVVKESKIVSKIDDNNLSTPAIIPNNRKDEKDKINDSNASNTNPVNAESTTVTNNSKKNELNENIPQSSNTIDNSNAQTTSDTKPSENLLNNIDSSQKKTMKDFILDNEKDKKSHWSISAFYGPNFFAENRLKVLNQQFAAIINSYEDQSTENYSFNSGLIIGYHISKKFSVSTGGIYSTIAYSSTYPTLHAKIGSDNLYHYIYRTSCGSIEIPNDDNVVLTSKDSLKSSATCSQVIKIFSVPLLVKYQVTKNRFSFYANTGIAINQVIYQVAKIVIGSSEYTIVNNVSGQRKTSYSYIFGAGLDYNLNNGMSVFVEPSFKTSITSLTQNNFFNCYPYSFGLNLGLSLHF